MGKKSTPAPPPAPDPYATAAAQTGSNVETALTNTALQNANEVTPYGRVDYNITGIQKVAGRDIPQYTRTTSLSPEQQKLYDLQSSAETSLAQAANDAVPRLAGVIGSALPSTPTFQSLGTMLPNLKTSVNLDKVGTTLGDVGAVQRSVGPDDFSADRLRVEDALNQRLNPQLQQSRDALETKLVNQGLVRGTSAFNSAMDEQTRQENDAHLAVIAQGGQEQSRQFGNALQAGAFANSAQQQAFDQEQARGLYGLGATQFNNGVEMDAANFGNNAEGALYQAKKDAIQYDNGTAQQNWTNQIAARTQPINEVAALLGTGQVNVPQAPGFQGGNVSDTPVGQYVYQSASLNQDAWKTKVQAQAQNNAGLYGLGSSVVGGLFKLSDPRVKRDVTPIGVRLASGLSLYSYRYVGGGPFEVGVMADEVEAIRPDAVLVLPSGLRLVDYARVH